MGGGKTAKSAIFWVGALYPPSVVYGSKDLIFALNNLPPEMTEQPKNSEKSPKWCHFDPKYGCFWPKIGVFGKFFIFGAIFIYILIPNSLESVLKSSNCDLQDESYAIFKFLGGMGVVGGSKKIFFEKKFFEKKIFWPPYYRQGKFFTLIAPYTPHQLPIAPKTSDIF